MKRLLLSFHTTKEDAFAETCEISRTVFCKANSIENIHIVHNEPIEDRHPAWAIVPLIRKFVDAYDQICVVQHDVLIRSLTTDVFEYIQSLPSTACETLDPCVTCVSNGSILFFDCTAKAIISEFLNAWWHAASTADMSTPNAIQTLLAMKTTRHVLADLSEEGVSPLVHIHDGFKLVRHNVARKWLAKLVSKRTDNKRIAIVMRKQNFYSNGAGQNCIFIKHTFEALGYDVDFVSNDIGGEVTEAIPYSFKLLTGICLDDYFLFLFGTQVPPNEFIEELKKKGIKRAMFNPANVIDQIHQEHFLYAEKKASTPLFEMNFRKTSNEVWVLDNHSESSLEYLQIINRQIIPVIEIPITWEPLFLYNNGKLPLYNPVLPSEKVDFAILEPNISYCKSGWLPLIICEKFYLDFPSKVGNVYLFNTPSSRPTAIGMIESLKLHEDKKIQQMDRYPINEILPFLANKKNPVIFIAHSINSPLNYAYFDVMHSGFPLIHNSKYMKQAGAGYYYNTLFEGAAHISKILTDFEPASYLKQSREYLTRFQEYNPVNLEKFRRLLPASQTVFGIADRIVVYVISVNETRKARMRKMLADFNLPSQIVFFQGCTPADSKEYLNYKHKEYNEPDGLICCSRSHIAALDHYAKTYPSKDYVLILEDDVTLIKDGFLAALQKAVDLWERHSEIDFLNIGYLLKKKSVFKRQEECLRWDLSSYGGALWGTQGYLVKHRVAAEMGSVLSVPTAKQLYDAIFNRLHVDLKGVPYCNKILNLSPDHFLSLLWNQGYVSPPLVIEDPSVASNITDTANVTRYDVEAELPAGQFLKDFYGY